MATSSITHNFVVSNPNSVKRFVAAIDEADRDRTPKQTLPGRQLTNPQEILALMSKRKEKSDSLDLHFVFQKTAASFSSLFCFSSSNSRRTSSPYLSIIHHK